MISLQKKDCCGCAACANICSHKCITMREDAEGFLFPCVDSLNCVQCGLCDRVCPIQHVPQNNMVIKVFAGKNKNEIERFRSSSGGIFGLLARNYIENGGVVVGCKLDEGMQAIHAVVENLQDLDSLFSSKYVQSSTQGIFIKVKQLLEKGEKVLFSGTPCQVAALRNFLGGEKKNLATIDILCHGVPSPKILREYIQRLEKRYDSRMISLSFRCKQKSWKRLYINAVFKNGRRHHLYSGYDSYMQLFLSDCLQRESCFHCPYNTLYRPGDISLGDFWGIGKKYPDFDDNRGVSMILTNNEKGEKLWNSINERVEYFETDIDTAVYGNKVLVQHLPSDVARNEFYRDYVMFGLDRAIERNAPEKSKCYQIYYNFMRWGLDLLRKIKHESY